MKRKQTKASSLQELLQSEPLQSGRVGGDPAPDTVLGTVAIPVLLVLFAWAAVWVAEVLG